MLRRNRPGSGGPQGQRPPQGRNEINFDAAIQTLKAMFSNVDESVLRLVLDTNGGRMETTVENLLQMTGEQEATDQAAAPSAPGPVGVAVAAPAPVAARPVPAASAADHLGPGPVAARADIAGPAAPLIDSSERRQDNIPAMEVPSGAAYVPPAAESTSPPRGNSPKRMTTARHDLQADFLRPPSYFHNEGKASTSEQEKEDEKLAQILQDSMFMAELQKHPEWLQEAQGRNAAPKRPAPQRNWSVRNSGSVNQNGQAEYTRSINDANNNRYESFKSTVSGLGTAAKSRLAMLAEKFKRNENQESKADYQALSSLYDEPPRPNQNL